MSASRVSTSKQHWKIGLYVAAVVAIPWLWMGDFGLPGWVELLVFMWIPGLLAILFRMMFRDGFADAGWRVGKARFWAWAYLGPLAMAAISVLAAWSAGRVTVSSRLPSNKCSTACWQAALVGFGCFCKRVVQPGFLQLLVSASCQAFSSLWARSWAGGVICSHR